MPPLLRTRLELLREMEPPSVSPPDKEVVPITTVSAKPPVKTLLETITVPPVAAPDVRTMLLAAFGNTVIVEPTALMVPVTFTE